MRPGATQNQGSTNQTQEDGQRPMRQPCNDVTQNEHNDKNTVTAPGDKRNGKTNITGLGDGKIIKTRHTPARYTTQNEEINRNPNSALHQKGIITALEAKEVNIL